jgi:hypothetical protein
MAEGVGARMRKGVAAVDLTVTPIGFESLTANMIAVA